MRELIEEAFLKSSVSLYRLAKDAGLQPGQIKKFFSGERDMVTDSVERILAALNVKIELTQIEGGDGSELI